MLVRKQMTNFTVYYVMIAYLSLVVLISCDLLYLSLASPY